MSYRATTVKGYCLYETSSAFQKSIRRCMVDEAFYWGMELYESNYAEYAWKRMTIMVSEDIGLAEPTLPATFAALRANYLYLQDKKDARHKPERICFMHAIMLLARAKKSRAVDNALIHYHDIYVENFKEENRLPIPDWALDKHTARGKAMGKDFRDFMVTGSHLENVYDDPIEDHYYDLAFEVMERYEASQAIKSTGRAAFLAQAKEAEQQKDLFSE